jgi:hypothetical protein
MITISEMKIRAIMGYYYQEDHVNQKLMYKIISFDEKHVNYILTAANHSPETKPVVIYTVCYH